MIDLETVVYYKHKETGLCVDIRYLKGNRDKEIMLLEDVRSMKKKKYQIREIPFSEDWEMKLYYFKPVEYNRLMIGDIDKALNDKLLNLIDERMIKNGR